MTRRSHLGLFSGSKEQAATFISAAWPPRMSLRDAAPPPPGQEEPATRRSEDDAAAPRSQLPDLYVKDGTVYTDSRAVARCFDKHHADVLRDLDTLMEHDADLRYVYFQELRTPHPAIPDKTIRHVEMTKDGFTLLAMGYTGKEAIRFKVAYIERFNAMERELRQPAPPLRRGEKLSVP